MLLSYMTFVFCYFHGSHSAADIANKTVVLFSYGSGLASSMYLLRVASDHASGSVLDRLLSSVSDVRERLDSRMKVEPAEFARIMKLREDTHHCGRLSFAVSDTVQKLVLSSLVIAVLTHFRFCEVTHVKLRVTVSFQITRIADLTSSHVLCPVWLLSYCTV